jgi:pilus assembly protein CpaB
MKLAVAGLCLLGLIAAACAAVLVNGLRGSTVLVVPGKEKVEDKVDVGVLYVTRPVAAMTVVDGSMVTTKIMPRKDAPAGYLTSSIEVVGKVISTPLVAGQPFTKSCFADLSGPRQLAAVIPKGKRAVGISVTDYAGLEGLIYPGSMVDVMVSFKAADGGTPQTHRDAITTTLLENIQVLAFDQQTVVSPGKVMGEEGYRSGGARRVTLLVDTKQAKAVEIGMEQGVLSLALRNPLDGGDADKESVSVHSIMGDEPPIGLRVPPAELNKAWEATLKTVMGTFGKSEADKQSTTRPAIEVVAPHWDTTILHGTQVETRSFPLPASATEKQGTGEKQGSGDDRLQALGSDHN